MGQAITASPAIDGWVATSLTPPMLATATQPASVMNSRRFMHDLTQAEAHMISLFDAYGGGLLRGTHGRHDGSSGGTYGGARMFIFSRREQKREFCFSVGKLGQTY